jgi:hypothetical protein
MRCQIQRPLSGSSRRRRRPATVRQLLRQAPRRIAAVHSRWCPLRATLGWIRDESAGGGVEQALLTRIGVHNTCPPVFPYVLEIV